MDHNNNNMQKFWFKQCVFFLPIFFLEQFRHEILSGENSRHGPELKKIFLQFFPFGDRFYHIFTP